MSKTKKFRGLKFKYKIDGISNELTNKFQTLEEFLETEFPLRRPSFQCLQDGSADPAPFSRLPDCAWKQNVPLLRR